LRERVRPKSGGLAQGYCDACRIRFCRRCVQQVCRTNLQAIQSESEKLDLDGPTHNIIRDAIQLIFIERKTLLYRLLGEAKSALTEAGEQLAGSLSIAEYNAEVNRAEAVIAAALTRLHREINNVLADQELAEAERCQFELMKEMIRRRAADMREQPLPRRAPLQLIPTFEIDPCEFGGMEFCPTHRPQQQCHHCQSSSVALELQGCKRCFRDRPFCRECNWERRALNCTPDSDKIGPAFTARIDFSQLRLAPLPQCQEGALKPLLFGDQSGESVHEAQALAYANVCYSRLMVLVEKMASKQGKANLEATYAIMLVETEVAFQIVLTYSHDSRTGVPTKLREHRTLGSCVLEANPMLSMVRGRCWMEWPTGVIELPGREPKKEAIYNKGKDNLHHAEMRAFFFARRVSRRILFIAPSRECCFQCHDSFRALGLLETVPPALRGSGATVEEDLESPPKIMDDDDIKSPAQPRKDEDDDDDPMSLEKPNF
jgi:hypothetical protein